jgi:hypothetical protein
MQMPPRSSAYIARLATGKHALREVHTGHFRIDAGRSHRMFLNPCADVSHTHTTSRTHETRLENQECRLSHLSSSRPLRLLKPGLQHRSRERSVSSAIKLNIRESHTLRARVSCCLSVVVPSCSHYVALVDVSRTSHNFEEHSESQRTLSALSTKRHTVARSGMS